MKFVSASPFVGSLAALSMSAVLCHSAVSAPKPGAKTPAVRRVLTSNAAVRVLHAIPDGPNVVVSIDGRKVMDNVSFKTLSAYQEIAAGAHRITINAAGQTTPLAQATVTLYRGDSYTLVATTTSRKPSLQIQNESTGGIPAGRAQLRVYHYAPGAGTVAITVPTVASAANKRDYATLIPQLKFKNVETRSVKPGAYTLQVRTATGQLLKQLPVATLAAGTRTSAFAIGRASDNSFDVLVAPQHSR